MSKTRKSPNIPAKNIPVSLRGDCWQGEDNEFWTVASQPRGFTWVRARESQEVECETFHMKDEVEQLARNKDKEGPAKVLKGRPEAKQKKKEKKETKGRESNVKRFVENPREPHFLLRTLEDRLIPKMFVNEFKVDNPSAPRRFYSKGTLSCDLKLHRGLYSVHQIPKVGYWIRLQYQNDLLAQECTFLDRHHLICTWYDSTQLIVLGPDPKFEEDIILRLSQPQQVAIYDYNENGAAVSLFILFL